MRWLLYAGIFLGGAVVGGLIVREIALQKITDPINRAADALLGSDSYAAGHVKTQVNAWLRSN